jgi:hypothetical protein
LVLYKEQQNDINFRQIFQKQRIFLNQSIAADTSITIPGSANRAAASRLCAEAAGFDRGDRYYLRFINAGSRGVADSDMQGGGGMSAVLAIAVDQSKKGILKMQHYAGGLLPPLRSRKYCRI